MKITIDGVERKLRVSQKNGAISLRHGEGIHTMWDVIGTLKPAGGRVVTYAVRDPNGFLNPTAGSRNDALAGQVRRWDAERAEEAAETKRVVDAHLERLRLVCKDLFDAEESAHLTPDARAQLERIACLDETPPSYLALQIDDGSGGPWSRGPSVSVSFGWKNLAESRVTIGSSGAIPGTLDEMERYLELGQKALEFGRAAEGILKKIGEAK